MVALATLVERSGVRWLQVGAAGLDAHAQTLHLSDGNVLAYDWLSIANSPAANRQDTERALPGAREHALFLHPKEHFAQMWPRVAAMGTQQPLRLAIVGSSANAVEVALAVRHRLPDAAVTLLCGAAWPDANYPRGLQLQVDSTLKQRRVTILQDHALAVHADAVQLGCGAKLACDLVLLADGTHPPAWLKNSGLALDENHDVSIDNQLRSTSHPQVLGSSTTCDASSNLAHLQARNLRAALAGNPLLSEKPLTRSLHLLSCGDRCAIASWGAYAARSRWFWWLRNWLERRQMSRYSA